MAEECGEGVVVKAEVEVVEGGTGHGNGELELVHGRGVGGKHGDDMAFANAEGGDGGSKLETSAVGLGPGEGGGAVVDDGSAVAVDDSCSL